MAWQAIVIILLILANGVFAMAEIALVSARRTRLEMLANEGKSGARTAIDLASKPSRFLSTVQFGITLVGVLAGAYGGATFADPLSARLASIGPLRPYSQAIALAAVVFVITYLSLIIGELIPKRLALTRPETIACLVAVPMRTLSKIAGPAVALLSHPTDWIMALLGIRPSQEPPVTEEELRILIDQGTRAGVFDASEKDMLVGVLRLKDRRAGSLITPRRDIVWLDLNTTFSKTLDRIRSSGFAVFPVCQGNLDDVVGVLHAKDLLALYLTLDPPDLRKAMRPPFLVPENRPLLDLLDGFRKSGHHMALVLDEYGGVAGLVTVNDIAVSIVGALPPTGGPDEDQAVQREDGSWLLDGMLPADELRDLFHLPGSALDEEAYRTVGGLVMARLERIPRPGDNFRWCGLRIEVVDMDGNRVDKVLVQDIRETPAEPGHPVEG